MIELYIELLFTDKPIVALLIMLEKRETSVSTDPYSA